MQKFEPMLASKNLTCPGSIVKVKGLSNGEVFGYLTIMEVFRESVGKMAFALAECKCGKHKLIRASSITQGKTLSCGCLLKVTNVDNGGAHNIKHSLYGSGIYNSWAAMKARCDNPTATGYCRYGGRGITYTSEWVEFAEFNADMGDSWFEGATIDRINNDGDYCRDNCQWLTRSDNSIKGATHAAI